MTADQEVLQDLLRRVESATGQDRELDALLACHFVFRNLRPATPDDFGGVYGFRAGDIKTEHGFLMAHGYTRGVDDALELVARVLPGWAWHLSGYDPEAGWSLEPGGEDYRLPYAVLASDEYVTDEETFGQDRVTYEARAKTPALALLAALLKALIAEQAAGQSATGKSVDGSTPQTPESPQ